MDGENNGKPYFLMDDLGGFPIFLETTKWIWVGGGRGGWMNHLKIQASFQSEHIN